MSWVLCEKTVHRFHIERLSEQVPLSVIDALGFKPPSLFLCLNAFSHNSESECFPQLYQGVDNRIGLDTVVDPRYEGLVDLQHINRKFSQAGKRRVPSTQVVDSDAHPNRFEGIGGIR